MMHPRGASFLPAFSLAAVGLLWACGEREPHDDGGQIVLPAPEEEIFELRAGPLSVDEQERARALSCAEGTLTAELPTAALEFAVDVSGSMSLAPVPGSPSKWESTKAALIELVDSLPPDTEIGAVFFPNQATERNCTTDEGECIPGAPVPVAHCVNTENLVPLAPLGESDSSARQNFLTELEAVNPAGATPTHDAYLLAVGALADLPAHEPPFVVLITDGQPTFEQGCSGSGLAQEPVNEGPIVEAIKLARKHGVSTFVIGSPGSEENAQTDGDARPWLSRAARAGGTQKEECSDEGPDYCHFDMTEEADFGEGLTRTLRSILRRTGTCEFRAPSFSEQKNVDQSKLNAIFHPGFGLAEVLAKQEDSSCESGWYQEDEALRLCAETCAQLHADDRSYIELLFGCAPVVSPPPK